MWMWTIGQWVAFLCRLASKLLKVINFESQVSKIGTNYNRAAWVEFADLNFFFAAGRFKENQLRTASGGMTTCLLQTKDISVKGDRFLQIGYG